MMAIRYAQPLPVIEKEFVEPSPSDSFIYWLFRYRCVECGKPASEINEINPRGRSKKNILDWKNRVSLCRDCHSKFHEHGVTPEKIDKMKQARVEFLLRTGRDEYVNYQENVIC